MSQMRLRHKKPINSYVGQGNYDSNSGHDEDFAKNAINNKKLRLMKQRPSNEQTKKYAEILLQFVNVVNQDYRNHCAKYMVPKQLPEQEQQKIEVIDNLAGNKPLKDNGYLKSQEVVSKQQQKIRKSENYINKISLTKKIRKEKIFVEEQPKIKETKDNQNKIVTTINVQTKPPLPINSRQPLNLQKQKVQPPPTPPPTPTPPPNPPPNVNPNPTPTQNSMPSIEQIQQIQQMQQQQLFQTQLMAMNSGLYPMYPYPMSQFVNYQMYMEQLKNNPYISLQNMMGMFAPGMGNNYIPFSKLPFTRNTGQNQQKKQEPQQPKNQSKTENPPNQQKTNQILNSSLIQPQIQAQPINRQQQPKVPQNAKKQNSEGSIQPIDFKRKSCYHIAIAYNIHFARLKQNGLLNQGTTEQGYRKLDPTYPARKIRNRKHSDSVGR